MYVGRYPFVLLYKINWFWEKSVYTEGLNKSLLKIEHPRQFHMVGDGFKVTQYIPWYMKSMTPGTSPFLMLDYNAPWTLPPQGEHRPGVGFHPHRGFETVTIVYSGEIEHQDTAWNGGVIWPDEVQWMTAGSGLLHNEFMTERFSKTWGVQHAVQLWVDLPKEYKLTPPRYQALTRENIPVLPFSGGKIRPFSGHVSAIDGTGQILTATGIAETHSRVDIYDVIFDHSWTLEFSFHGGDTAFVLVVSGEGAIAGKSVISGDMVTFSQNDEKITLSSDEHMRCLVLAGEPLGQNVVQHGPFVMTSAHEIDEAWQDFQSGKMG